MTRHRLAQRRYSETRDIVFNNTVYSMTVGFEEGEALEVFLGMEKSAGTMADVAARDQAILISIALQHGASLQTLADAMTKTAAGEPEGLAGVALQQMIEWGRV